MQISARCLWRTIACFALFLLSVLGSITAFAQSAEYQIKAATVFRYIKYIQWPQKKLKPESPLVIGVVGQEAMADRLAEAVAGRQISGHSVVIKRITALPEVEGCHVIFVGRSEDANARDIIRRAGRETLTVGESRDFVKNGGMFFLQTESENGARVTTFYDKRSVARSKLKFDDEAMKAFYPIE